MTGRSWARFSAMVVTALALAWQAAPASAQFGPCKEDVAKFCAEVKQGGGRIFNCLTSHQAELSPACKAHVEKMRAEGRPGRGPKGAKGWRAGSAECRADIDKFCKDVQPGGGRILECLDQHKSELSDGCKSHVEQMKAEGRPMKGTGSGPTPGQGQPTQ